MLKPKIWLRLNGRITGAVKCSVGYTEGCCGMSMPEAEERRGRFSPGMLLIQFGRVEGMD